MRPDMAKVIVERPRYGGGGARKGRDLPDELLPKNQGMRQSYGYNHKQLNENLGPLRRFLLSCAGRLWNDVYSEISNHLRPTSAVQQHVRDHIKDYVAIKVHKGVDGKLYEHKHYLGMTPLEKSRVLLYVDPDTGILTKNKAVTERRSNRNTPGTYAYRIAHEPPAFVQLTDGNELRLVDKIWYIFTWDVVPPAGQREYIDIDGNEVVQRVPHWRTDCYTGESVSSDRKYRNSKQQLNSGDLKYYGLTNSC